MRPMRYNVREFIVGNKQSGLNSLDIGIKSSTPFANGLNIWLQSPILGSNPNTSNF